MDFTQIIVSFFSAAAGVLGTYFAFKKEAKTDSANIEINLMRLVDERTATLISRLESDIAKKDAQITRLENLVDAITLTAMDVIRELRKHNPEAADAYINDLQVKRQ